jgi:hypothetical protein
MAPIDCRHRRILLARRTRVKVADDVPGVIAPDDVPGVIAPDDVPGVIAPDDVPVGMDAEGRRAQGCLGRQLAAKRTARARGRRPGVIADDVPGVIACDDESGETSRLTGRGSGCYIRPSKHRTAA